MERAVVNSSRQDRETLQQSCNFLAKLTQLESQIPKPTRETLSSSLSRGAQISSSHRGSSNMLLVAGVMAKDP